MVMLDSWLRSHIQTSVTHNGGAGVDPVSPDSWRLGLGTEAQELAW
jgi:hypothetical protein